LDPDVIVRGLLARESRSGVFTQFWAAIAKAAEPANNTEGLAFAHLAFDLKEFAFATRLWAEAHAFIHRLRWPDPTMRHVIADEWAYGTPVHFIPPENCAFRWKGAVF